MLRITQINNLERTQKKTTPSDAFSFSIDNDNARFGIMEILSQLHTGDDRNRHVFLFPRLRRKLTFTIHILQPMNDFYRFKGSAHKKLPNENEN